MSYFQSLKRAMFNYLASKSSTFNILTSLTHCTGDATNPTTIASGGTETLIFTADSGYELPSSVTVTGASYTWEPSTGMLDISNPTDVVVITIVGVRVFNITTSLSGVIADSDNPTTVTENSTATLRFTAVTGYSLPSSVTVTGSTYSWFSGTLILLVPTENVSITIVGTSDNNISI